MRSRIIAKAVVLATALCSVASFAQVGGPAAGKGAPRGNEIAAYVYGMDQAKLGEDLSFAIVTGLAADKKYSEAKKGAREFYKKADQEQKKKHGKLLEDKDFCKIGADYGVEYLCIIDIEKAGRGNSVWARILDLEKCQIIATGESKALIRNDAEVAAVANEIVKELTQRKIGKRSIAVAEPPPPPPPPPRGNEIAAYVYGMDQAKLGEDLSFAIVTGLAADKKYSEAKKGAREFYKKADIEQKKKHGRLLEDKDFCKIGADYGVEYLCIIDIEKSGRGNSVWARILDLETCQIIATGESKALIRNDAEVKAVAGEIVKELTQRRIGKRSIAVEAAPPAPVAAAPAPVAAAPVAAAPVAEDKGGRDRHNKAPAAGLYFKAPPISADDVPVAGMAANDIAAAVARVNLAGAANDGAYTLLIDKDVTLAARQMLEVANRQLTIIGLDKERTITAAAGGAFIINRTPSLTLGDKITIRGVANMTQELISSMSGARGSVTMLAGSKLTGFVNSGTNMTYPVRLNGITFTMEGGEISGNTVTVGGNNAATAGVYVAGYGTFIMNGGTITGNTVNDGAIKGSTGNCAGVYVSMSGTFTMNGGVVSGNVRNGEGKDVFVDKAATSFTKNGGTIGELVNNKK